MDFVLASQSPRRKQLLKKIIEDFEIIPSDADETIAPNTDPTDAVMSLARRKADAVAQNNTGKAVIAADTIVVYDNEILGKPIDANDAKRMLHMLSGNSHRVITGVCIICGRDKYTFAESTAVSFSPISDDDIEQYVSTGEPMDKAGSYAIQGGAGKFVKSIDGDIDNVIGLPVKSLRLALQNMDLL